MFIKLYLIALSVFIVIDMIWLGFVAKNFYIKQIGSFMKADVGWVPALVFYLLFVAGLIVFVVSPALKNKDIMHAVVLGAFFGLVTYATYDLTNLATLKDWPLIVTIVDLIWGVVLSASVSSITYIIYTRFFG